MKLYLSTALTSLILATGAMAENASRGDANVTGPEAAAMATDTPTGAAVDQSSRGDANVSGAEATAGGLLKTDDAGAKLSVDDSSRGYNNQTGEEIATGAEGADTGEALTVPGVAQADPNASRGDDNLSGPEVANDEGNIEIRKSAEGTDADTATRGAEAVRSPEAADGDAGEETFTSGVNTSSRGNNNLQGSEVTTGSDGG